MLCPKNGNLMTDYLGQIASESQTKVYHKKVTFLGDKCANQCKWAQCTFNIVTKATHSIMELNDAANVTRLTTKQQNERSLASVGIASNIHSCWLSSNALVSVNVVTLRQARLVPGWVTVLEQINNLGAEPGTQIYSA